MQENSSHFLHSSQAKVLFVATPYTTCIKISECQQFSQSISFKEYKNEKSICERIWEKGALGAE